MRRFTYALGSAMNVVIVNDTAYVNGGAAKLAIAEALGLADRGHAIIFFAAVDPVDEALSRHPNIRVLSTHQFDLFADPNRLRAFIQGWWNETASRAAQLIAESLSSHQTIVHLHIWSRALSSSVAMVFLRAGFPTICTLHDFLLACPTGTFFLHQEEKICKIRPMSATCVGTNCDTRSYPQKLWRVGRQVIQKQFGRIPTDLTDYVVHSQLAMEVMRAHLPPGASIHTLTVYIEAKKAPPATPSENSSFVYLGRLVREKGVGMLARCAAAEKLPVTFVGSGALEQEIVEANPDAVITGWRNPQEIMEHLRHARALVFPSLWLETLGLVVLEAAAVGVPSIVPDTSAAREIVEDGVTGFHFRGGDEADLRSKMRQLNDPDVAGRLGRAAYDRFWSSSYASLESHAASLESIYKNCFAEHCRMFLHNSL